MKNAILLAITVMTVFLMTFGCQTPVEADKDPINPGALAVQVSKIDDITSRFTDNNTQIGTLSNDIATKAEKIAIAYPKIKDAGVVKMSAEKIGLINTENIKNTIGLTAVKGQLNEASGEIEKLKTENTELKSDMQRGINKVLLLTYSLCILGIVAGVVLIFFNQHQNGIIALGSSVTIMGFVYFLQTYAWILGIVAGIVFVGLLVLCGIKILNDQKTKKELIKSFEVVKSATKYEDAERLAITKIQSESTINEVDRIKKDIL